MKKKLQILIIMACSLIAAGNVYAKKQAGVYLTAADYTSQKISYPDGKIHVNNSVLELNYITVSDNGKKLKLKKSDIFGYKTGETAYRFYNNAEYQIAEAGPVYIYIQLTRETPGSKSMKMIRHYYFSSSVTAPVMPLTLDNLKNEFRTNEQFTDLLDQFFSNGTVTAYDKAHNMYKVNYVYNKSKKQ